MYIVWTGGEGCLRTIRGFVWDAGNRAHIARHGVTPDEAEEAVTLWPLFRRTRDERYVALGRTAAGRLLVVVFVFANAAAGFVRVVTARAMTAEEARYYRRKGK